jgi:dTDP-4-dehydrorhamnose reductase
MARSKMMDHILVTGASGQLGQEFQQILNRQSLKTTFWSRKDADISDARFGQRVRAVKPGLIINCAAYTAVDLAEQQAQAAHLINTESVRILAHTGKDLKIPIIHFSSDYVYHNTDGLPMKETATLSPQGVYARTKLQGEEHLLSIHPAALVFRVSWLYSTYGHNFPKTIIRLCKDRQTLNVVKDQIGAPTFAKDLAEAIFTIIQQNPTYDDFVRISGVYNYCNEGTTNWAEMARFIVAVMGFDCIINPIPSSEFPTAAPRPANSRLNLSKFKETFRQEIRKWDESLRICLSSLQNEKTSDAL